MIRQNMRIEYDKLLLRRFIDSYFLRPLVTQIPGGIDLVIQDVIFSFSAPELCDVGWDAIVNTC